MLQDAELVVPRRGRRDRCAVRTFRSAIWCLAVWTCGSAIALAQEPARADALKVFLDCSASCDLDYLRREIAIVNHVRDREDADVHVLITSQPTGGGGVEYTLQFIGAGRFAGIGQTLTHASLNTSTVDERRTALAEVLRRGFVRYIAETPLADQMVITFRVEPDSAASDPAADRWNLWVFRTTLIATFSGESLNAGRSVRVGAAASRTSNAWRVSVSTTGDYRDDHFELAPGETFRSISKGLAVNTLAVKSLTEHWSAGIVGTAASSTFLNYDFRMRAAPGLEYNVFPYADSTRRLLTLQYTVGMNTFNYREETTFGRLAEQLVDHRLGTLLTMIRPWGSTAMEVTFSQFLEKPDKYSLGVLAQANVRIARGLSLNALVTFSRTHDQLYLPKAAATVEEILVREQQLATSYRYTTAFGFTFTFGSIFNNVVNPRFGRGAEDLADF